MRIAKIRQLNKTELLHEKIDLAIVASGFEERARCVAGMIGERPINRVALGFKEYREHPERKVNDDFMENLKYAFTILGGGDWHAARLLAASKIGNSERFVGTVLVDISSMTRTWLGAFVAYIGALERSEPLRTLFTYVPASYRPQKDSYPQNRVVGPLPAYTGLRYPDAPTALIIGLGHDPERALGIQREIDPGLTAVFWADPAIDKRYIASCKKANNILLNDINDEYMYQYPLVDFPTTFSRLEDVTSYLAREWRVVLTSLGPKIFSLASFLVAVNNPQVSVWRVSAASDVPQIPKSPANKLIVADVRWEL